MDDHPPLQEVGSLASGLCCLQACLPPGSFTASLVLFSVGIYRYGMDGLSLGFYHLGVNSALSPLCGKSFAVWICSGLIFGQIAWICRLSGVLFYSSLWRSCLSLPDLSFFTTRDGSWIFFLVYTQAHLLTFLFIFTSALQTSCHRKASSWTFFNNSVSGQT